MSMYMNMDPALGFSPTGFKVLPRADSNCDVGVLGTGGICVKESTCNGALFATDCGQGYECCFFNRCTVSQGSGYCKNDTSDACDGNFYTGESKNPPCKGPNEMRCCVNYSDMNNGTSSTSVSSMSATATTTNTNTASTSASTNTSTSTSSADSGLQGNEIGGIVGGVVGGVVVLVAAVLLWLWWRKKNGAAAAGAATEEFTPVSTKMDKDGFSELPEYGSSGVPMQEIGEGRQRVEVDAHGHELYEMEGHSPIAELDGGDIRKPGH